MLCENCGLVQSLLQPSDSTPPLSNSENGTNCDDGRGAGPDSPARHPADNSECGIVDQVAHPHGNQQDSSQAPTQPRTVAAAAVPAPGVPQAPATDGHGSVMLHPAPDEAPPSVATGTSAVQAPAQPAVNSRASTAEGVHSSRTAAPIGELFVGAAQAGTSAGAGAGADARANPSGGCDSTTRRAPNDAPAATNAGSRHTVASALTPSQCTVRTSHSLPMRGRCHVSLLSLAARRARPRLCVRDVSLLALCPDTVVAGRHALVHCAAQTIHAA